MEQDNNKPSEQIKNTIAKIDQILRLYQMIKKNDLSKKSLVEKKINQMIGVLKKQKVYYKIEGFLTKAIISAIQDPKLPIKIQKGSSLMSSKSNLSYQSDKSFQNSINKNMDKSEEQFKMKGFSSSSNLNGINQNNTSLNKIQSLNSFNNMVNSNFGSGMGFNSLNINNKPGFNGNIQKSSQNLKNIPNIQYQKDIQMNFDNFEQFFERHKNHIHDILALNEDIFASLKQIEQQKGNLLYLFGLNTPQTKKIKKLYICTLMKFSQSQILNTNYILQSTFQKEYKMFQNNLRNPVGLIIKGNSLQQLKIQHIKFLIQMKSPNPIIIFLDSIKDRKGFVIILSQQIIKKIKDLNKVQFQSKVIQLRQLYQKNKFDLSKFQVVKQRLVITKNLTRIVTQVIQSAKNAIQIQSSNQCIKQQPNKFPYKLHSKYYVSSKNDFQVYFIQNQILSIKIGFKQKQFDAFKKYVLQQAPTKGIFILTTSVLKQTSQINRQFLKLLIQSKNRDPYFIINFTGINNKKTLILTMKQNISQEFISTFSSIKFVDLEKENQLTNLSVSVNKQNYKNYQTQNKVEVVDITVAKKK